MDVVVLLVQLAHPVGLTRQVGDAVRPLGQRQHVSRMRLARGRELANLHQACACELAQRFEQPIADPPFGLGFGLDDRLGDQPRQHAECVDLGISDFLHAFEAEATGKH